MPRSPLLCTPLPRSPLTKAAALAAALAPPAASAEPMTLMELFTVDRLATIGATWMVTSLRSVAKITYADMDIAPLEGRMALTGVKIEPYETPSGEECLVSIDRMVLASAPLDQLDFTALDADLIGVFVSPGCFEPEAAVMMGQFGLDGVALDRADLRFDYLYATGGATVDLHAVAADLADIRAEVVFDYLALDADSEEPVMELASAEIDIVDTGALTRFGPLIPPEARDPAALGQMLRMLAMPPDWPEIDAGTSPKPNGGGGEDDVVTLDRPSAEDDAAGAMLDAAAAEIAKFVGGAGRLRLTLRPETPVRIEEDFVEDFATFAETFHPVITAGAAPEVATMTAADLAALEDWLAGSATAVSDADALAAARAFLTGVGAPRNPESGVTVLTALLDRGHGEAVDLALEHLPALAPETGYEIAWQAAAGGHRGAFAQLDALERQMPLGAVLAVQSRAQAPRDGLAAEPARALQTRALAAMTGLGAPRNYGDAYLMALLAAAAGDRAAPALVDEIEAMGKRFAGDEAQIWRDGLARLRSEANTLWFAPTAQ